MIPFQGNTTPGGVIEWTHYWDDPESNWVLKGSKDHRPVYFARHKTLSKVEKAIKQFELTCGDEHVHLK